MARSLTLTLTAPGLVLVGLLAGCGPTGTAGAGASDPAASAPPRDLNRVLPDAVAATRQAGSARVQTLVTSSAGSPGSSFSSETTADGLLDLATGNQRLVTRQPTGGESETLVLDGVRYQRLPAQAASQPNRKPWLRLPGSPSTGLSEPSEFLDALGRATRPVTQAGQEQVRDAATTRYRTELDLAALVASSPPAAGSTPSAGRPPAAGRPDPLALLRQVLGRDTLPLELWIDDQQRIRRIRIDLPLPAAGIAISNGTSVTAASPGGTAPAAPPPAGPAPTGPPPTPAAPTPPSTPGAAPTSSGSTTSTIELYEFGVPVDLQPPPADQVQEPPVSRPAPVPGQTPQPPAPAPAPVPSPAR